MKTKKRKAVRCDYCGRDAVLVDSSEVYRRSYGPIYLCRQCNAYVGCHKGTTRPLGRLADATLRAAKIEAHRAFDRLWRERVRLGGHHGACRQGAYQWLAEQLRIEPKECHIGMFDVELCRRVVEVCKGVTV